MTQTEEQDGFTLSCIADLTAIDGLGELRAQKLIDIGIFNRVTLATTPINKLVLNGFSKGTGQKLIMAAREHCDAEYGFMSAEDNERVHRQDTLTSGSASLDSLLGGPGFETRRMYEVYGLVGVGKTNLLHQVTCTASLPIEQGGLDTTTIYLDTEGTFSIKLLRQIAGRFSQDPQAPLPRVIHTLPPTTDILLYLCEDKLMRKALECNARLICLDTLATPFHGEYGDDRQLIGERNRKVARVLHALKWTAWVTNAVVLIANQVEENYCGYGPPWWPWGCNWQQDTQVCLQMKTKGSRSDGLRSFRIDRGIMIPEMEECIVQVSDQGFADIPPTKRREGK